VGAEVTDAMGREAPEPIAPAMIKNFAPGSADSE
jgi:hypothetical protein